MFPWQRRKFPYTNFHELNADWILDEVKDAAEAAETAAAEVQTWDDRITEAQNKAEQARLAANTAVRTSTQALQTAEGIADTANLALERSEHALATAGAAQTAAETAVNTANAASSAANSATQMAATANRNANTALQQAGQAADSASAAKTAAANSATAAQAAQAQAEAAAAAVANKAEIYRFTVNRPEEVGPSGESLDSTQWNTPFQDLLAALDDEKTIPVLSVRYETSTQGVYSTTVQVVPTIEQKNQSTIVLSWFNVPVAGTPVYTRLVVNATTELANYYEYALSGGGVEPVVVTVNPAGESGPSWNGSTWLALTNAYDHGVAFAQLGDEIVPINTKNKATGRLLIIRTFINPDLAIVRTSQLELRNDFTAVLTINQYPAT